MEVDCCDVTGAAEWRYGGAGGPPLEARSDGGHDVATVVDGEMGLLLSIDNKEGLVESRSDSVVELGGRPAPLFPIPGSLTRGAMLLASLDDSLAAFLRCCIQ